jgi:hypothetical protein
MRAISLILLLSLFSSGCYQFLPVEEGVMPDPGQEVRVHLSPAMAFEVASTPIPGVETVEGEVYESEAQSLAVWTSLLHSRFFSFRANGAVLYIPHDHISRLETRRLVPAQTVLAIGTVAAAIVTIFTIADAVSGGGSFTGGGEGGAEGSIFPSFLGTVSLRTR